MLSIPHDAEMDTHDRVRRIVLQAMASLLPEDERTPQRKPIQSFTDRLLHAALGPDRHGLSGVVEVMRRAGVRNLDIAEIYVPRVAELLGVGWCSDELDFGRVSIGSSRLQLLLRQLDDEWAMAHPRRSTACPAVLVGVPAGVQHTLGASVLAGQLRHRGFSVHLDPEITPGALAGRLARQRYSGVFLSASGAAHLETCRELVTIGKKEGRGTPVILGGTILEHHDDIERETGADRATSDIAEALSVCGFDGARLFDPEAEIPETVMPAGVIR